MYPKSIRTTTFHIHRGGRGEDGAHYIGGGWGGGMATLDHIYFIFRFVLKSRLRFPGGVTKVTRYMCLLQQMVPVYVVVHNGPS